MKDTVIKGTGNSRTLRTVPNAASLYSTHESFMQALIDGTFPVDIGPVNPTGVDVEGTALSTPNLLTAATAALYGKGDTATPNDIFAAIRPLITAAHNAGAKISFGTYTGTGSLTEVQPKRIYVPFKTKLFCVIPNLGSMSSLGSITLWLLCCGTNGFLYNVISTTRFSAYGVTATITESYIEFSASEVNNPSAAYTYTAIG